MAKREGCDGKSASRQTLIGACFDGSELTTAAAGDVVDSAPRLVRCIHGDGIGVLEGHIYRILPDAKEEAEGFLRVVDESGEPFYYVACSFLPL